MNKEIFEAFASDKNIRIKNFDNISSINFSRKAFYDKTWNERTIMARGLFVNNHRYDIVCRGYEKFFNVDEMPSTTIDALRNIDYPITAYVKENGYLGLLGVDIETNKLIFASKSSLDSDFALNFEALTKKKLDDSALENLKDELISKNICLVFEVIAPIFDPHIIEYDKADVVLLDVIYRDIQFKKYSYSELQLFAKTWGLDYKKKAFTLNTYEELIKLIEKVKDYSYKYDNNWIEGFVFEDSSGFQFKLKCGYYNFWKTVRRIVFQNGNINKALSYMNDEQSKMLKEVISICDGESLFDLRKKYNKKEGLN